jgi:nitrite reductase (NADH) small subunit/3-phenylpropionate/trans-cinnamate dioxygenase ferredoxin subunit
MPWVTLCRVDELIEGRGKYVEIASHQLAVFLHEGRPYAMDNYCPHAGGNLAGGTIEDGCAVCPWHQWAFRLDNGQLRDSPSVGVEMYRVRVVDRAGSRCVVEVDLPQT